MKNLSLAITHSLSFLNKTLLIIDNNKKAAKEAISDIMLVDNEDEYANHDIRKIAKDFRDDFEDDMDIYDDEIALFNTDIEVISKNKDDEKVIYTLSKYKHYHRIYKDYRKKKFKAAYESMEATKDRCSNDKDYVKFIAINKVFIPVVKMSNLLDNIIDKLEKIT